MLIGVGHLADRVLGFAAYSADGTLSGWAHHQLQGSNLQGALYQVPSEEVEKMHETASVGRSWYKVVEVDVAVGPAIIPAITYLIEKSTAVYAPADSYFARFLQVSRRLACPEEIPGRTSTDHQPSLAR